MTNANANQAEKFILLIDGHHGVYIPQIFASNFPTTDWGVTEEQADILLRGPDLEENAEEYWDAWDTVLNNAEWHSGNGDGEGESEEKSEEENERDKFVLYPGECGDLFMVKAADLTEEDEW